MGILDKIFGKSERKNKEDKLVLFVNLFMNLAGADGERSKEEGDYIIDYVSRYSSEITNEKWMEIVSKAESLGDNAMGMAIELDQNEKIKLVEELIGLAGSDGHFHGAEFSWIMVFSETIGLDSKIVQDEILKNHEIDMDEFDKSLREIENRLEDTVGEKIDLTESENLTDTRDNQKELVSELIKPILDIVKLHVDMEKVEEERNNYIEKLTSRKQMDGVIDSEIRSKYLILDKELNLKKQEVLYNELIFLVSFHPQFLPSALNDFAYNQFIQKKYNEGLNSVALSIELHFFVMASTDDKIDEHYVSKLAGFLDTFSLGLYLKENYKDALKISNILIPLCPNDSCISEHLTNRGKSKLKLNDKEGAKLDFEKALEKDKDFEEARNLLQILKQSNEKDVFSKNDELENIGDYPKINSNTKKSTYDNEPIITEWTNSEKEEYLNNSRKVNTKLLYDLREEYYKLYDNNNNSEAIKKLTQIIEQIPVLKGQSLIAYTDPSDILNGILLEEIYFNRSQLYSQLNLIDDAKNDLIKAVNSNPGRKEPIIHHHLGSTMIQCGDFTSCIEHFNIAIEKDSEYYDSYYMRAVAYSSDESELTDINKAIDDLKKYLEHDPNDNAANNLLNILQQNSNT